MKLALFVVLVACTLSAMTAVPRLRRAMDPEEAASSTTPTTPRTCASTTPCAWSFYTNPVSKHITLTINNTYCECSPVSTCTMDEDDKDAVGSFTWLCKES